MIHKAWSGIEQVHYCFARSSVKFQGRTALKIIELDPNWAFPDCNSSLNSPMGTKCCTKLGGHRRGALLFLAATKQLYKWYFPSVCHTFLAATKQLYDWFSPSVCLSVCLSVTPFWLCYHHCIMKFSEVITKDQGKVHAKGQGQRSKVKVTEVTTQLNLFRTVTPVWIDIWWWNDAHSLIMLRRGALLFCKVICQISRSHGSKNRRIWPRLVVSGL